jgi:NADH-quinone oxidoreductase subunit E
MPATTETRNAPAPSIPEEYRDSVIRLVEKHASQRGWLIAILGEIQAEYGYLPQGALRQLSRKTGRSLEEIYGVATFYRSFSLEPRGRHHVCACLGTACHVRGAPRIVEELERQLGIQAGQTTPDKEFSMDTVNCLGACALGPVVVTDGSYHSKVKKSAVSELLEAARKGNGSAGAGSDPWDFALDLICPNCQQPLKDDSLVLDNYPSVPLKTTWEERPGWVRLSRLVGSNQAETELSIPKGSVVEFLCPHCQAQLPSPGGCWHCGGPVVSLLVLGGGTMNFCSRRGCPHHGLELP